MLGIAAQTAAAEAPKWGAHIDLEGKAGTDRHLGEADLFLPVAQNDHTLLFADIRGRLDDESSREGNFGLGLRHMLDSGWNLGGYSFFDRRHSEHHNFFNQITVGAEALSMDWDLRVNGYVPIGRTTQNVDSLSTAEVSGAGIVFRGGEERSLGGFDAEIGWRAPIFGPDADRQVRVYGGGYRFADEGVPMVAGPRGRAELVFDEVPGLWQGSRLALGAEWQHDDPRGSQGFLSARLRIPLQEEAKASRLTPIERRMADPIVRDIDVVSQAGAYGPTETASASNGGKITVISSSSDIAAAITAAGANSTVILTGSFTNNDNAITLSSGQTVMGSGSLTVRSPSGRTATLAKTSGATVTATFTANGGIVNMADSSTLTGLTITQTGSGNMGPFGVYATGKTGVVISNNNINVSHNMNVAYGIYLTGGSSATVSGNTITASMDNGFGGSAYGVRLNSASALIAGNTISATHTISNPTASNRSAVYGDGAYANILSDSTGNTFSTSAGCGGARSGTLYYTNSSGVSTSC